MTLFVAAITIPLGLDLYLPAPETNPITDEKIELGRKLFNDRRLSRDGSISCASCHDEKRAFSDGHSVSPGVSGRRGRRNAPALINRGYGRAFFWDGRVKTLEEQVLKPIQDPNEMDLTIAEASVRTGLDASTMAMALATYVRSILSGDAPYDRFVSGDRNALTSEQLLGLQLFRGKAQCSTCHAGPNFTDEGLHNTGVAWREGKFVDEGAGRGRFKTPSLREISRTAPYMHDGSFATLSDVVEFYDGGGRANPAIDPDIRKLNLSQDEKRALVAFLGTLTGRLTAGLRILPFHSWTALRDEDYQGDHQLLRVYDSPAFGSRPRRVLV